MNFKFWKSEKRELPQTTTSSDALAGGTIMSFLMQQQSALNISTFFRGVWLISTSVGQLPIYTKKVDSKGKTSILKNHPTTLLWTDPTTLVDMKTIQRQICKDVILKGNAYVYIKRGADGTPIALQYLQPSDVTVNYNKQTKLLRYQCSIVSNTSIPKDDMLHFKLFSDDGVIGRSVINYALGDINLTNQANAQALDFFEKGMNKTSGVIKVQSPLNEQQRNQILNTWNATYSSAKAGVTVLPGNMDYQSIQINPDEAQLLESREFNEIMICNWLNLNPAQLGFKGFTPFRDIESQNTELLSRTLMAYIAMIESELTRKLLKADEQGKVKIILDTAAYLRPNKQSEGQYYATLIDKGILTRNEARKALGYCELDGLSEIIIPYTDINQNTVGNKKGETLNEEDENNEE